MINYALEHEAEKAAWDIWVASYPNFTKETFVPFSEFKSETIKSRPRTTPKAWEEIEEEMAEIVRAYEAKKRGD